MRALAATTSNCNILEFIVVARICEKLGPRRWLAWRSRFSGYCQQIVDGRHVIRRPPRVARGYVAYNAMTTQKRWTRWELIVLCWAVSLLLTIHPFRPLA